MSQANPSEKQCTDYAHNFILNGVKGKAFRAAFPDAKCTEETAHTKGCKLFKLSQIQSRIAQLQAISSQNSEKVFEITVEKIKTMLLSAAEKGLSDKVDQFGNVIPVNISGAVSALSEVNKMDGNHAPTKTSISGDAANPLTAVTIDRKEYLEARKSMLNNDDC